MVLLLAALGLLSLDAVTSAQEKKLEKLTVALSGGGPNRALLWSAKHLGMFEKHGLDTSILFK